MSDLISLERGMLPWKPSESSEIELVLHRYDKPLMGVLRQQGTAYFFECVYGEAEPASAWVYFHLSDDEVSELDQLEVHLLSKWTSRRLVTRPSMMCIAVDGEGIAVTQLVENQSQLDSAIQLLVERFMEYQRHVSDATVSNRAPRAIAEVLSHA